MMKKEKRKKQKKTEKESEGKILKKKQMHMGRRVVKARGPQLAGLQPAKATWPSSRDPRSTKKDGTHVTS